MKKAKSILSALIGRIYAGEIIGEWARCIQKRKDPSIFANLYLELMRDPHDDELRKNTSAFLVFADTRDWYEILDELSPMLDKKMLKIFNSSAAETFYTSWKLMVKSQVADYWNQFLKEAKGKRKTG